MVDGILVLVDGILVLVDGILVLVDGILVLVDGILVLVDGILVLVDGILVLVDGILVLVDGFRVLYFCQPILGSLIYLVIFVFWEKRAAAPTELIKVLVELKSLSYIFIFSAKNV